MKQKWDDDWIYFTRKVRRGIAVLILIFVSIAIAPRLYHRYFSTIPQYDIQYSSIAQAENKTPKKRKENQPKQQKTYHLPTEKFNPNFYTLQDWIALGLSEKQASSIVKYIEKGGEIKVKTDLKKLYAINDELYHLLEPLIDLPDVLERKTNDNYSDSFQEKNIAKEDETTAKMEFITEENPISINLATSEELQKIKGVGPYFANKIIALRENYGGILEAEQLLEIYKLDAEKLEEILPFIYINPNEINKLNINTASEEKLRQHPLITIDMAKSIVYYRENYRPYQQLDDLLLSPYIDAKILKKIQPYLTVGEE